MLFPKTSKKTRPKDRVSDCRQKLFQTRNSSLEQLLSTSFRIFEQKIKAPCLSIARWLISLNSLQQTLASYASRLFKPRYLVQRIPCFSFASANIRSIVCFRFCKLIYSDLLGEDVPLHPSDLPKHVS